MCGWQIFAFEGSERRKVTVWENIASVGFNFPLAILMAPQPSAVAFANVQWAIISGFIHAVEPV